MEILLFPLCKNAAVRRALQLRISDDKASTLNYSSLGLRRRLYLRILVLSQVHDLANSFSLPFLSHPSPFTSLLLTIFPQHLFIFQNPNWFRFSKNKYLIFLGVFYWLHWEKCIWTRNEHCWQVLQCRFNPPVTTNKSKWFISVTISPWAGGPIEMRLPLMRNID